MREMRRKACKRERYRDRQREREWSCLLMLTLVPPLLLHHHHHNQVLRVVSKGPACFVRLLDKVRVYTLSLAKGWIFRVNAFASRGRLLRRQRALAHSKRFADALRSSEMATHPQWLTHRTHQPPPPPLPPPPLLQSTGELFVQCPVDEFPGVAVESCSDSSRYFVIRALDEGSGQHAFVGIGFTERTDAFDFNVALSDHFKHEKLDKKVAEQADEPCVPFRSVAAHPITLLPHLVRESVN
jgi:hypothetical protein